MPFKKKLLSVAHNPVDLSVLINTLQHVLCYLRQPGSDLTYQSKNALFPLLLCGVPQGSILGLIFHH